MKLLICTQAVDANDPVLGFFVHWIELLAPGFESIEVICLREGSHTLPANVHVHTLGEGGALGRAYRLKKIAWQLRRNYDRVFVHMNPEYLIVAGLLWKLLDKPTAFWYNHPADNLRLRLAVLFAQQIFYTSPYAATARFSKARQMPVGIDTDLFRPGEAHERGALYLQGRVAASKRVELALAALRIVRERVPATLDIVGPEDTAYARELKARFKDLIEAGGVRFLGPRKNEETPALYAVHGAALNLAAAGHFDKSAFEAMACGTPVVVSSPAFRGLVPQEWIVEGEGPAALAEALARLIALPEAEYHALGATLRAEVVRRHSLATLVSELTAALS